jgi:hypothetical protein
MIGLIYDALPLAGVGPFTSQQCRFGGLSQSLAYACCILNHR